MDDVGVAADGDVEVGLALAHQRSKAELTVEQLARRARLPAPHVRAMEEGRQVPYLTDLVQLAQALGKRPSTLFAELHQGATQHVDRR